MKFKRLKLVKRYIGGGSGSPQTTQSIPDWARPYIEKTMGTAQSAYDTGSLNKVAGTSGLQSKAFGTGASDIIDTTQAGEGTLASQNARLTADATAGPYDTTALKDKAILEAQQKTSQLGSQYGGAGVLGSARQAVEQGANDAATKAQFATIDQTAAQTNFQNKMAAEQGLGSNVNTSTNLATGEANSLAQLGGLERGISQQQDDSTWQGLQRYASTIYGTPAKQTQSSGGK